MSTQLLPYRAEPAELRRFLLALARGRTPSQLRQNEFSTKTFDGVSAAAEVLGLTNGRTGGLSPSGRRYAMASGETAVEAAAEIVQSYAPYAQLVRAASEQAAATSLRWIQEWWAEHGWGGSESNRSEAAPVFARFVETAGLGRFVQGRKGRESRIEWNGAGAPSKSTIVTVARETGEEEDVKRLGEVERMEVTAPLASSSSPTPGEPNRLSWELAPGRRLVLELPSGLLAEERDRALKLVSLLLGGG